MNGGQLKFDDVLKIWAQIEALTEEKAKLALFGLVIQKLSRDDGVAFDEEEIRKVLEFTTKLKNQRSEAER